MVLAKSHTKSLRLGDWTFSSSLPVEMYMFSFLLSTLTFHRLPKDVSYWIRPARMLMPPCISLTHAYWHFRISYIIFDIIARSTDISSRRRKKYVPLRTCRSFLKPRHPNINTSGIQTLHQEIITYLSLLINAVKPLLTSTAGFSRNRLFPIIVPFLLIPQNNYRLCLSIWGKQIIYFLQN